MRPEQSLAGRKGSTCEWAPGYADWDDRSGGPESFLALFVDGVCQRRCARTSLVHPTEQFRITDQRGLRGWVRLPRNPISNRLHDLKWFGDQHRQHLDLRTCRNARTPKLFEKNAHGDSDSPPMALSSRKATIALATSSGCSTSIM